MDEDRYTRITLRIPTDLHNKLQMSAERTSHSMNAEIIARLAQTFEDSQKLADKQLDQVADILADKIVTRLANTQKK